MRVLVLEAEPGAAADAVQELEAHGHAVVRCHEEGRPAFPCAGLAGGGDCPLEVGGVDVAVTVRRHARSAPTPSEDGIACALRARVPVVVAGESMYNPYSVLGGVTVGTDDLANAIAEVVRDARPEHSRVALEALRASLEVNGVTTEGANARVWRTRTGLHAVLELDESASPWVRDIVAVRVTGALRTYDAGAPQIDVSIAPV